MWHKQRVRSHSCVKYWENRNGLFSVCTCSTERTRWHTDHWARCWTATLSGQELINLRENERTDYNGVQNNGRKWLASCFKWLPDTIRLTLLPSFLRPLPDNTTQRWTCLRDDRNISSEFEWDERTPTFALLLKRPMNSSYQTLNTQLCTPQPRLQTGRS
jgi:hypothetical protein